MIVFAIDYKTTGLDSMNTIYAGKHWSKRKGYAAVIHQIVVSSLRQTNIPRNPLTRPFKVEILYPPDRVDIDNHLYLSKCIVDGLKGWVIKDDNGHHMTGINQEFANVDKIHVIIREVGNNERHED